MQPDSPPRFVARFGDVWRLKAPGEPLGPPVLVVSSNLYLMADAELVVVVPVRGTTWMGPRLVTESVPSVGVAELDRITSVPRGWLVERVLSLPGDRHEDIGRRVRNLIGP
jgi:mRNA-degrading endonuclease toxin of MazEF toxin-antitoxin module